MLLVVSWPAFSSSWQIFTSSSRLIRPGRRCSTTSRLITSSAGVASFSSIRPSKNVSISLSAAAVSSGVADALNIVAVSLLNRGRSSAAAPSRAQITSDGTGSAKDSTRSAGFGPASRSSMRSSTITWIEGRSASIRLIMNDAVSERRIWSCRGLSMLRKLLATCRRRTWPSLTCG